MTAIPARKSRARPFPPVAEAAYGPYAAIILVISNCLVKRDKVDSLVDGLEGCGWTLVLRLADQGNLLTI
jgi:hypothetical protein